MIFPSPPLGVVPVVAIADMYIATFLFAAAVGVANIAGVVAVAGVSTFNDFSTQTGVACAGFSPTNSQGSDIFSAAMSDLSPLWIGAQCEGTINASNCNGEGSCINCVGPACPDEEQCGNCFNVKCTSSLDGETSGACTGNTIKVKIVDACPASHPENYCKIPEFGGARIHSSV
ncbi:hypothetical protein CERSUDRAFT_97266 [Gelatoporia subvermispora B]|uniref:Expansin-like EG45 domain-containing protein n=1 Tax=Ceriporiopsis subvermispora (strain B) TaxID=914234 RepID=M2R7L4_CERS8|nr:hypothetical protein CERSUDRAFT_97266 [Gelatoporia subvermispora B]